MTLAQHIEKLLADNDCVIVPHLGGFISCYSPAQWIEKDNLFLPPGRMTGFNPRLTINDGLLVQSYMAERHISFAEASRQVQREADALLAELHAQGSVELPRIGKLHLSIRNTFDFTPDHQTTSAELYGFSNFRMQKLARHATSAKPVSFTPPVPEKRVQRQRIKLHFSASFWSNAAAVAAIIILFFAISIPVKNTEIINGNYAQLLPTEMLSTISQQSLAITPVAPTRQSCPTPPSVQATPQAEDSPVATEALSKASTAPATKVQTTPETVKEKAPKSTQTAVSHPTKAPASPKGSSETSRATSSPARKYHIIVASVGTETDARRLAADLVKKGYTRAQAIIGDGKMRVSIDSFANETEAYQAVNKLRQEEIYQNAWVLKK